jgi:hypothetical protein
MTTNQDFCHQYAHASNEDTAENGNMSYDNGVMYSYNTAIAKKLDNCTLFNCTSYSVSTSKQQQHLRYSLSGTIIEIDGLNTGTRFTKEEIVAGLTHSLKESVNNLAKSKRESTRNRYLLEIHNLFLTLKQLLDRKVLLKKDLNKELKALLKKEVNPVTLDKLVAIEKKEIAKHKKDAIRRAEERRADFQQEVDDFKTGEANYISYGARGLICNGFDLIKLVDNGKNILTSRNIKIPISHGLKLFRLATTQKELNESKSNWANFKINFIYPIDRIEANGNCFVSCHKFEYSEILRCYLYEYLNQK